ncbi:MAG TPA: hypothetical protein VFN35_21375 [Ktedonobacteraceae bacterium]|nr:hypothetical protein [Ktedonobacteraceae bacterium]
MKAVHIISLLGRLAFMLTMIIGLLFWVAQISFLSILFQFLLQIGLRNIHELLGIVGAAALLTLGILAVRVRGARLSGVGSIFYAFLLPAFGLTQAAILVGNLHWLIQIFHLLVGIGAMYLARETEKRYQHLTSTRDKHVESGIAVLQDI